MRRETSPLSQQHRFRGALTPCGRAWPPWAALSAAAGISSGTFQILKAEELGPGAPHSLPQPRCPQPLPLPPGSSASDPTAGKQRAGTVRGRLRPSPQFPLLPRGFPPCPPASPSGVSFSLEAAGRDGLWAGWSRGRKPLCSCRCERECAEDRDGRTGAGAPARPAERGGASAAVAWICRRLCAISSGPRPAGWVGGWGLHARHSPLNR